MKCQNTKSFNDRKLAKQAGYSGYASYILEVTGLNPGRDADHPDDFGVFYVPGK